MDYVCRLSDAICNCGWRREILLLLFLGPLSPKGYPGLISRLEACVSYLKCEDCFLILVGCIIIAARREDEGSTPCMYACGWLLNSPQSGVQNCAAIA